MAIYDLYLESGPQRRKTMVHIPQLLGCVANGLTTEAALDATPEAIRAFRRFLDRNGELVDQDESVDLRVVEHITAGKMLGDGSPYLSFSCDTGPVPTAEVDLGTHRLTALLRELSQWAGTRTDEQLDEEPATGRTARAILLHVIGAQGPTLSISLGSAPGFGTIQGAAKRGELPIPVALSDTGELARVLLESTTAEQRSHTRVMSSGEYTVRKAIRHSLEDAWEHLAELSRRPNGPPLSPPFAGVEA